MSFEADLDKLLQGQSAALKDQERQGIVTAQKDFITSTLLPDLITIIVKLEEIDEFPSLYYTMPRPSSQVAFDNLPDCIILAWDSIPDPTAKYLHDGFLQYRKGIAIHIHNNDELDIGSAYEISLFAKLRNRRKGHGLVRDANFAIEYQRALLSEFQKQVDEGTDFSIYNHFEWHGMFYGAGQYHGNGINIPWLDT